MYTHVCIHVYVFWFDFVHDFLYTAEQHDPLFSSEYAPSIYQYMKEREVSYWTICTCTCIFTLYSVHVVLNQCIHYNVQCALYSTCK